MNVNNFDIDKLYKYLEKKIYKWWYKLSIGYLLVIYSNNKYKFITSNKQTTDAKIKDITLKWIELENNKDVKYILWSNMSRDALYNFIYYLLEKTPNKMIEQFIKEKRYIKNNS